MDQYSVGGSAEKLDELLSADTCDPVIDAYKKDVDRTLLRENLKLTVEERLEKLTDVTRFLEGLREAGRKMRQRSLGQS